MGYICASVIRAVEEYQIASLCLCQWDMLGCVVLVLSYTGQADSCFAIAPLNQTAAIEAGVGVITAKHIRPALILQGFIEDGLYRCVAEIGDCQILGYQTDIEHISVLIPPAAIFLDGISFL